MNLNDLLPAIRPVLAEFDRLELAYYVGGSVASSMYGEPRSTIDVDIGADVPQSAMRELISKWEPNFYVSESAMREAVERGRCFNLIHLATSLKVDVFVCGKDVFNVSVLKRRLVRMIAVGDESLSVCFATPEDVILHKLVAEAASFGETRLRGITRCCRSFLYCHPDLCEHCFHHLFQS